MNLYRLRSVFSIGILISLFTQCNINEIPNLDNTYLPNYEGSIAIIVGRDTLTIGDFIRELSEDTTVLREGENMDLFFMYEDSTSFSLGSNFIDIGTFSNNKTIESPVPFGFVTPTETTLEIEQVVNFNFVTNEGETIDSVFYESGFLALVFTSDFPGDVTYTISTNSFINTVSEENITISSGFEYEGVVPVTDTESVTLTDFKTLLNISGDSSIFQINVLASIVVPSGTALTGEESINVQMDVIDPVFDAIYGKFGQDTFNIDAQEISFDVFSEFSNTGLSFEAPTISFEFQNSFGIPTGLDFGNIYAGYDDQEDMPLTGSFAEELQIIDASGSEDEGSYAVSTIEMNSTNTNIGDILASSPNRLIMELTGITNPEGEANNFLLSDSEISIKSTIVLPLSIQLNQFEYESEFELGDISQLESGEEITIQLKTINELPFDGEIDLIFVDENETDIDSVISIQILKSPEVFDENGKASEPSENTALIELDAAKIDALVNAAKLRIVTRFNSYGYQQNEFVQIFSDYSLITVVSLKGKVSINLNDKSSE